MDTERLSDHFMHPWYSFQNEVIAAYNTLDLDGLVSVSDASEEE